MSHEFDVPYLYVKAMHGIKVIEKCGDWANERTDARTFSRKDGWLVDYHFQRFIFMERTESINKRTIFNHTNMFTLAILRCSFRNEDWDEGYFDSDIVQMFIQTSITSPHFCIRIRNVVSSWTAETRILANDSEQTQGSFSGSPQFNSGGTVDLLLSYSVTYWQF